MEAESLHTEYKALDILKSKDTMRHLSETCVALANADGGRIFIGIDDKTRSAPDNQKISEEKINLAEKSLNGLCRGVRLTMSSVLTAENGGQYFAIDVSDVEYCIATTSTGKVMVRHGDQCLAANPDEITMLLAKKEMRSWEKIQTKYRVDNQAKESMKLLAAEIRKSKRCKEHVRQMSDMQMAEHYQMVEDNFLTQFGVLWIGNSRQRRALSHPIMVQYIVYDNAENKIRKEEWRDQMHNPKDLLLDIEREAHELKYAFEFPDGLFRKPLRKYNERVIRELLVNSFAHHSFEFPNDIFICVYPNKLQITSPGSLPRGVTKDNILHKRYRRNPMMIELFQVLQLMEGEGSGYDLVYEINALEAKALPIVESSSEEVTVTQEATILNEELLPLLDYIQDKGLFNLSQKAYTAFGLIGREGSMSALKLATMLQLREEEKLQDYLSLLLEEQLILTRGRNKNKSYYINPVLIKNCSMNIQTSLKTLEPHVLHALILEDLRLHPGSRMAEIISRLQNANAAQVTKMVREMAKTELRKEGGRKMMRYFLSEKEEK